jgi:hypothetical protein
VGSSIGGSGGSGAGDLGGGALAGGGGVGALPHPLFSHAQSFLPTRSQSDAAVLAKRAERQFRHFAYQPDLTKGQRRKQISFWGHTSKLKKGHTRKMYFFQSHTGKKLYTICYLFILIFRNLILDILATK